MLSYKPFVSLLVAALLGSSVGADEVKSRRMEATIRFLADDLLEGRGTPSRGLDIAALYLAEELRALGWAPGNEDSYFQTYPLKDFTPQQARYEVSLNGIDLSPEEFILLPMGLDPAQSPLRFDLVFAGHGIAAPERTVDDFENLDVREKAVVTLLGAPWELDREAIHAYDRAVGKAVQVGVRGGTLLLYVTDEFTASLDDPPSAEMPFFREMAEVPIAYLSTSSAPWAPILVTSPAAFDRALASASGNTYAEWKKHLGRGTRPGLELAASIELKILTKPRESRARNVIAMLLGSDPALRDEWVVLSAHYDHLGAHAAPPGEDGIWNGADDNASGTAAVLEIARQLSANARPRRSVLVLFTSGEDRGLLGSAHYSLQPLVPYDRVVANINVDMVGRSDGSVQAIAHGSDEMFSRAAEIGKKNEIVVRPDPHPSWRMVYFLDSYHFARFDVPFVHFSTDLHEDYHQPSDEADRIRYDELGRVLSAIYELTDYFAQGGERPSFKRPQWFLTRGH
jgi:hypothetical protein